MTEQEKFEQTVRYTGTAVNLQEMLGAREQRVRIQKQLISGFQAPLISFTMNIPGPVKVLPQIPEAFFEGISLIDGALKKAGLPLLHEETLPARTGPEAFFAVDAPPETIKKLMVPIEDGERIGRLYDIDVIRTDGVKVSREEIGLPARKCLLCGQPAHVCSRSRAHSVDELTAEIRRILADHNGHFRKESISHGI